MRNTDRTDNGYHDPRTLSPIRHDNNNIKYIFENSRTFRNALDRKRRSVRHGSRTDGQTGGRRAGRGLSADDAVDGRLLFDHGTVGTVHVRRVRTTGQEQVRDGQQERVGPAAPDVRSVRGPCDGRARRGRRRAFGAQQGRRRSDQKVWRARAAQSARSPRRILQVLGVRHRRGDHQVRNGKNPRNVFHTEEREKTNGQNLKYKITLVL